VGRKPLMDEWGGSGGDSFLQPFLNKNKKNIIFPAQLYFSGGL